MWQDVCGQQLSPQGSLWNLLIAFPLDHIRDAVASEIWLDNYDDDATGAGPTTTGEEGSRRRRRRRHRLWIYGTHLEDSDYQLGKYRL